MPVLSCVILYPCASVLIRGSFLFTSLAVSFAMNTKNTRGLASIIIPCWNQLEFTRQCIRALKSHTRPPWELIVIDNGSTDHTADYLAGVQDGAAAPVTVITQHNQPRVSGRDQPGVEGRARGLFGAAE